MATGLSVNRLIRTSVNLSPAASARRGFGTLLAIGDSDVIDGAERLRSYTTLESVLDDFGTSAPEYKAAVLYFAQSPRPTTLMIGRMFSAASTAILRGGALKSTEQNLANFTAVSAGSFKIDVDGATKTVSALDLSTAVSLPDVASKVEAAISGGVATVEWNGSQFVVYSVSTGATATLSYASATGSGTDISALLKLTAATASRAPIDGFGVETPLEAVAVMSDRSAVWYGVTFASGIMPTTQQYLDVAAYIEGVDLDRMFFITTQDAGVMDSADVANIAIDLEALAYKRTFLLYSGSNAYAAVSACAREFSVNFNANKSTITLMYKTMPGVTAEVITESQAQTLKARKCSVFVEYVNDTAIIQYAAMASGHFIDEIHGLAWLKDAVQNAVYNLLYQSKTKIPQTDAGQNQIVGVISGVLREAVNNGLIAAGQWNADGFGQLSRGDYLENGFYIFTQPMALQDQSIREQRIAPPIQVAIKLAGAIQECDIIIDVNR